MRSGSIDYSEVKSLALKAQYRVRMCYRVCHVPDTLHMVRTWKARLDRLSLMLSVTRPVLPKKHVLQQRR